MGRRGFLAALTTALAGTWFARFLPAPEPINVTVVHTVSSKMQFGFTYAGSLTYEQLEQMAVPNTIHASPRYMRTLYELED